jgi:hypothetical protein
LAHTELEMELSNSKSQIHNLQMELDGAIGREERENRRKGEVEGRLLELDGRLKASQEALAASKSGEMMVIGPLCARLNSRRISGYIRKFDQFASHKSSRIQRFYWANWWVRIVQNLEIF